MQVFKYSGTHIVVHLHWCPCRNPNPNPNLNPRYHKAPHLCRVWVLQVFKWLRTRGEFFVRYKNPNTGRWYDGRSVLAWAFLLKYLDLHDPSLSARFGPKGALKSTNVIIWKLRKYVVVSLPVMPVTNPHPNPNPLARYIFSMRDLLCRSVHDLAKSAYDNQKYTPKAWEPLINWIYGGANQAEIDRRLQKLTKFNKQDRDLHEVVALSMWRLGSSGNFPWGRGATRPSFYCLIPRTEKVANNKDSALTFFFQPPFLHSYARNTWWCTYRSNTLLFTLTQAWAYATQVRTILDKNPKMKMLAFPMEVWKLHRRIHHRFLRFWNCFARATDNLPQMQDGAVRDGGSGSDPADSDDVVDHSRPARGYEECHVINLLTTDSESEGEGGEGESDSESDEDKPTKKKVEACFEDSGNSSSEAEATIHGGDK